MRALVSPCQLSPGSWGWAQTQAAAEPQSNQTFLSFIHNKISQALFYDQGRCECVRPEVLCAQNLIKIPEIQLKLNKTNYQSCFHEYFNEMDNEHQ